MPIPTPNEARKTMPTSWHRERLIAVAEHVYRTQRGRRAAGKITIEK